MDTYYAASRTSERGGPTFIDATISRKGATEDCLFEITPKNAIAFKQKINFIPSQRVLKCAAFDGLVAVVIDRNLQILDKLLEEPVKTIPFNSSVDFVLWRRSVILVGLRSSEILLVCPRTYEIKLSRKLSSVSDEFEGKPFFVDAFVHSNNDPHCIDVVAVDVHGGLYCFESISLSVGNLDFTHDENTSLDIDIGSITGKFRKYLEEDCEVVSTVSPCGNMFYVAEENGFITLFEYESDNKKHIGRRFVHSVDALSSLQLSKMDVKIVKMSCNQGFLFTLLSSGNVAIFLDEELVFVKMLQLPTLTYVHDFVTVSSDLDTKVWVIFGAPGGSIQETFIGIFSATTLEMEFSTHIINSVEEVMFDSPDSVRMYTFAATSSPFEEPIGFFEVTENFSRLHYMSETSTDASLQKLLVKGRFSEAEQLAIKYGKNLDLVYKAKVKAQVSEIAGKNNNLADQKLENLFQDMLTCLKKIQDGEFICQFCLESNLPTINWFKELLILGTTRATECSATKAAISLLLTRKKFYTFEQVFIDGSIGDWHDFNNPENTMFLRCKWFLQNFEFDKCERVWRRHSGEFLSELNLVSFATFFITIFNHQLLSPECTSLFRIIFLDAIQKCVMEEDGNKELQKGQSIGTPEGLNEMAKHQVNSLEREKTWPSGAIGFVTRTMEAIQECTTIFQSQGLKNDSKIAKKTAITSKILDRLALLLQKLNELNELKSTYSIRIPFGSYYDSDLVQVVTLMLNELFLKDEIEQFISKFLQPFANREGLSLDHLFFAHIQSVMPSLSHFVNSMDIPYQERIVILTSYIGSPKIHLECILSIAKEWPVPWSPVIDNIVTRALKVKVDKEEDLLKKIRILQVQVPYRCLVNKYKLTKSALSNSTGIELAIKRIIKQNKPEYHEDCLELIKHTGILDADDVMELQFEMNLADMELPVDRAIPEKCSKENLKNMLLRILQAYRMVKHGVIGPEPYRIRKPEIWERFSSIGLLLAKKLNHSRSIEFFKLRQLIPNLWSVDKMYQADYPFSVLTIYLPESQNKPVSEIIADCKTISDVTFHPINDILTVAAAFFSPRRLKKLDNWWEILTVVVKTPGLLKNKIVEDAAVDNAHHLILQCPSATDSQIRMMEAFFVLVSKSFDKSIETMSKLVKIHHIFVTLREQEIPHEQEFLHIYKCFSYEGTDDYQDFLSKLKNFGVVLLKFGEQDLFLQVFTTIMKDCIGQAMENAYSKREESESYLQCASTVDALQNELLRDVSQYTDEELNPRILELLEALKAAGISLNAYALRQRSKKKLLDKLIDIKEHFLASQVALTFEVKDTSSWSKILQGFLNMKDKQKLRSVLESLKHITELWMLPEFANAWISVSENDPSFRDMCPIPLD